MRAVVLTSPRLLPVALATAVLALQPACATDGGGHHAGPRNELPRGITSLTRTEYTATAPGAGSTAATQDLLTGGLGRTGIGAAAAPVYADPLNPTALELRRNALYSNYRGLVDPTPGGGYGRLYGPNIDLAGNDTLGEGLVPGVEYLGVLDDKSGRKRVTMAIQIPASFDPKKPCIVVGPSSGSRGVYGAIGVSSEWGLKKGCAVALTDAGKGMGLYDPADDTVHRLDGTRATRAAAGEQSHFAPAIDDTQRIAFNAAFPNRLSLKHVHSQQNPEADWGTDTLAAVRYALWALNEEHGADLPRRHGKSQRFHADNTLVIAGAVSNGGAAVLRAAEQDRHGLIDGVVASEPNAQPERTQGYGIKFGGVPVANVGKPLFDYFTFANLYQPCAAQAAEAQMTGELSIHNYMTVVAMNPRAVNRCTALAAAGLVSGGTLAEQSADALAKLRNYGWTRFNDTMHNAHFGLGNAVIISTMYANAYSRASVLDNLCGASVAGVDATAAPAPLAAATKAASYATGNGTSNGSPAAVIVNDSVGGARRWDLAVSPGTGTPDLGFDVAMCQRALATGRDPRTGNALTASSVPTKAQSQAARQGVEEVLLNGKLRGTPTVIVAGRNDALLPVNHAARAYTAFNRDREGKRSELRYIEVENAQHFDAFNALTGFDTRYVPLHVYFIEAMNAMYAKLSAGQALPPSQVVRTTPRGGLPGAAPAVTRAQMPAIAATPAATDRIGFVGDSLAVPE